MQQSSEVRLFLRVEYPRRSVLCNIVAPASILVLPRNDTRGFDDQAIKKWHTSFKDYGPSDELNGLFAKSAEFLGSMLGELNTRIKVC